MPHLAHRCVQPGKFPSCTGLRWGADADVPAGSVGRSIRTAVTRAPLVRPSSFSEGQVAEKWGPSLSRAPRTVLPSAVGCGTGGSPAIRGQRVAGVVLDERTDGGVQRLRPARQGAGDQAGQHRPGGGDRGRATRRSPGCRMAAYSGVRHIRRHADAQHRTRWKRTPHPRDRLAKNRKKLEARGHLCRRSPSRKSAFRAAKLQAAPSPPNGVNINLGEAPPVPLTCNTR